MDGLAQGIRYGKAGRVSQNRRPDTSQDRDGVASLGADFHGGSVDDMKLQSRCLPFSSAIDVLTKSSDHLHPQSTHSIGFGTSESFVVIKGMAI